MERNNIITNAFLSKSKLTKPLILVTLLLFCIKFGYCWSNLIDQC